MPNYCLGELAEKVHGRVEGNPEIEISGVAGLEDAREGDISFLANPKYLKRIASTRAAAVIIGNKNGNVPSEMNYLVVENPYYSFLQTVELFHPQKRPFEEDVHPLAFVDPSAVLGAGVYVGPFVYIGAESRVGDNVILEARSYVGTGSSIGESTHLMPGATVLDRVQIGSRCLLQSGCVLGSDGFGFVCDSKGRQNKIPQVSGLVIGDDVEIGANTAIDRGTLAPTKIGNGVKFDNLVHVAHNVEIGDNSLIVAQVGISGSTKVGSSVIIAGQAGISGHIKIGSGVMVGAQAGVTKSLPENSKVSGYPARDHNDALRAQASFFKLPELFKQFKEILARVARLEDKLK